MELLGIALLLVMFVVAFGWIGLIILGIVKTRHGQKSVGTALTVTGSIWGLVAIGLLGFIVVSILREMKYSNPKPFDIKNYKGPTGKIVTTYHGDSTLVVRDTSHSKLWELRSTDGTFIAPAGSLDIESFRAIKIVQGHAWTASGKFGARDKTITLGKGVSANIKIGPPLTASISEPKVSGDKATMTLTLQDAEKHDFSLTGGTNDNPSFVVLDKSGKTVWKGSFEYG